MFVHEQFRFFKTLNILNYEMNINRLNLYERLRDFRVPNTVLDNIFSDEDDLAILEEAFQALIKDKYTEDESAEKIAKIIFKDLNIKPSYSIEEEK
jgi:hypothetical protein